MLKTQFTVYYTHICYYNSRFSHLKYSSEQFIMFLQTSRENFFMNLYALYRYQSIILLNQFKIMGKVFIYTSSIQTKLKCLQNVKTTVYYVCVHISAASITKKQILYYSVGCMSVSLSLIIQNGWSDFDKFLTCKCNAIKNNLGY